MRRRTEAKRNAILKVAEELFRKKGYQNTSMSEITAKVGGSKATIYGYFKSKKLLFQAVMEGVSLEAFRQQEYGPSDGSIQIIPWENYRQISVLIDDLLNSKDGMKKTLYRFSKNIMRTVCQPEFLEIYRLALGTSSKSGISQRFFETGPMHLVGNVEKYLQSCKEKGELQFKDIEVATAHFFGLVRGSIFEPHLFNYGKKMSRTEVQRKTRLAVDAFLKLYGTEKAGA